MRETYFAAPIPMTTASEVAKALIHFAEADPEGEPMTALRLHKLLYYCQGWYLAWFGRPLFADQIEAWKHGPVVPSVWATPWGQGRDPILDQGPSSVPDAERDAIAQVWSHYRMFSALGLREKTHEEPPWKQHYTPDGSLRCSNVIPASDLASYFGKEFERKTGDQRGSNGTDAGPGISLERLREELGC